MDSLLNEDVVKVLDDLLYAISDKSSEYFLDNPGEYLTVDASLQNTLLKFGFDIIGSKKEKQ